MPQQLTISAKDLGAFAYADPCPRCLWVQLHVKKLPYQTFPGIFSSIDRYNKLVVSRFFLREGKPPAWLASVGDIAETVDPPTYHKFSVVHQETGVTLRGEADGIFRLRDGSYAIVDYKTARYTPGQERMLPQYHAQLNGYAFIGNRLGLGPVSKLALVYMEPVTTGEPVQQAEVVDEAGFRLNLSATVVPVPLQPDTLIPPLLERARQLFATPRCPPGKDGCPNCAALAGLVASLG
ncbi:MAG: hypothetical protein EXR47_05645 [Dehalococcoidia bacterium]|nr:hypothetical protein [Dehalococcoidia bacterium]